MTTANVRVDAPAKLNLYLHVVGRRADGYHLLDSLVAFADVGDVVMAEAADDLVLSIDGPFAATLQGDDAENLVLRAARLLAQEAGITPKARLSLTKRLPVASGIGGGSSDAAAALKALVALWRLAVDDATLASLGVRLGADVPVCLGGRTAWLGGIGERLEPAPPVPACGLILVNPGVGLSTPSVFKARQGDFSSAGRFTQVPADAEALAALLGTRRNDLAAPAIGLVPVIAEVLAALEDLPGTLLARMSGSGATCFALFADPAEAARAGAALRSARPDWWVATGRLVEPAEALAQQGEMSRQVD